VTRPCISEMVEFSPSPDRERRSPPQAPRLPSSTAAGLYLILALSTAMFTRGVNGMSPKDEAAHPRYRKAGARVRFLAATSHSVSPHMVDSTPVLSRWRGGMRIRFAGHLLLRWSAVVNGYPTIGSPREQRYQRRYLIVRGR